jgi:hypothetical protein
MLYMVIEKYKTAGTIEMYRRVKKQGRMLPEGLEYISSWVDFNFTQCFQLMKTDNEKLLEQWMDQWKDLVEFEVVPVQTSAEAMRKIAPRL